MLTSMIVSSCNFIRSVSLHPWGAALAEWLSSWLAEQEDRGSIPGLATWIFRDWLSPASKSRYGWKIAKSTLILKTTNQPTLHPWFWPTYICTYWQIVLLSSLMSLPGGTCPFVRSIMTSTVATFKCSSEHFSRASSNFWRHSLGGRPGPTKGWPVPGQTGGYRIPMCYDHECTECNKLNTLLLAQKDKVNDTDCNNKECSKKKNVFHIHQQW